MKSIKYIILSVSIALTLFSSCDDFLDELPDNRVELSDISDIEGLLSNALPDACYYMFTHSLSDNAGDGGSAGYNIQVNEEAFKFMKFDSKGQDTPLFYWISCYEALANVNLAIEFIEARKNNTKEFEKYKHLYGEALVARAYNHFMLVNIWSKHYDPNTADTDLGIPYIKKPETKVFVDYDRGTVASVYKNIVEDFEAGYKLLNDELQKQPSYHFTTKSASAFASRLYLYMGNWDKVIEHSNKVLGNSLPEKIRSWNDEYKSMTGAEVEKHYTSSEQEANLLLRCGMSNFAKYYKFQRYGLTTSVKSYVYDNGLVAKGAYRYKFIGYDKPDRMYNYKFNFLFERLDVNAQLGYGYINNMLFTTEEVMFNCMEAYIMKKEYSKIVDWMNIFYSKRLYNLLWDYDPKHNAVTDESITNVYTNTGDKINPWFNIEEKQKIYLKAILHARRAEFMFEGLRWFDIKRYRLPVIHIDIDGKRYELKSDDPRKAIQLPDGAISHGLKPNPTE